MTYRNLGWSPENRERRKGTLTKQTYIFYTKSFPSLCFFIASFPFTILLRVFKEKMTCQISTCIHLRDTQCLTLEMQRENNWVCELMCLFKLFYINPLPVTLAF